MADRSLLRGGASAARVVVVASVVALLASLTLGSGFAHAQGEELRVVPGTETFKEHDLEDPLPASLTVSYGSQSWSLKALGSGLRKKHVFKVYVLVLYADSTADFGADPAAFVDSADVARRMILVLKRDVAGEKIAEVTAKGFVYNVWKQKPEAELQKRLDEFIGFFGGELKKGQTIELTYLPGIGLLTSVSGESKPIITEPRLARDIWGIWLGDRPVSEGLRDELVARVTPGRQPE